MSIRNKSYDKTFENSKNGALYQCKGGKIYNDPQLLSKRKVVINTSTSKQMYKFGKEKRFGNYAKPYIAFHYDLPSVRETFTTTFGKGNKLDIFKNVMKGKSHKYYDIPREFDLKRRNTPQYSFGKGRDVCKRPEFNIVKPTPGVGTYNIGKNLGDDALKFSIFGRDWANKKPSINRVITPGPGQYEEILRTNASGNYSSSLFGNTWKIKFAGPQRFKYDIIKTPGPGRYETISTFNRTGFYYPSKFHSMMAKTMSDRPKNFYASFKQSSTPGPGSYNVFSDFNGYTDSHKKCRCGRELGHLPTEGPFSGKKNYRKLKIDVSDSNSTNTNKRRKKKDIKYKTIS